jgi:uncharacterized protein (TIGR03067 family)
MSIRIRRILTVAVLMLTAVRPASAEPKKELAELQGAWKLVSVETDGKSAEARDDFARWVIKDNKVRYGGEVLAELAADPTTTPKCLDLTFVNPKRTFEGVYSLDGDTMKICVNRTTEGVRERPLGFATKGKENLRVLVFKRDKGEVKDGPEGAAYIALQVRLSDDNKEVVVADAIKGGPAEKAGLKKDDVILRVGTEDATNLRAFVGRIRQAKAGDEITVTIRRDGKEKDITVKAGVLPFYVLDDM